MVKALDLRSDPPVEVAIKLLPRGEFVRAPSMLARPQLTACGKGFACCLALFLNSPGPRARSPVRRGIKLPRTLWGTMRRQVRNYRQYVKREIQNQSSLRHPLIVSLREARHPTGCALCMVLWLSTGSDVPWPPHALHGQPSPPLLIVIVPLNATVQGSGMTRCVPAATVPCAERAMRRPGNMSRARLVQVFLTQTHLAIAMEYAQGGDLFNYTLGHRPHGRLAEQQARWIFQQLIIGLDYCHRRVRVVALPCTRLYPFERDTRALPCRTPSLSRLC